MLCAQPEINANPDVNATQSNYMQQMSTDRIIEMQDLIQMY